MAIANANILFFWDAGLGLLTPTRGGQPTFDRAGNAFVRQVEGLHLVSVTDSPRFEPNGLRVEVSQVNKLSDPFSIDPAEAGWTESGNFTTSDVTSILDGETAKKHSNPNDAADRYFTGVLSGTLTANPETIYAIAEEDNQAITSIGLLDSTVADFIVLVDFTWATGSAVVVASGAGTTETTGAVKLTDNGPVFGKPVYLIWATATPSNSGNNREFRIHPTGRTQNAETGILHAAQHVEAGHYSSPVDGTRVTETMYWADPPPPQALIQYSKFMALNEPGGLANTTKLTHIGTTAFGTAYLSIEHLTNGLRLAYHNGTATTNANPVLDWDPGDTIEFVGVLNSDASTRGIIRKNGEAVVAGAGAAPSGGLVTTWITDAALALNSSKSGGNKGVSQHQQLKFVTLASVDSATDGSGSGDEDLMAELAGLKLSPSGLDISNTL